MIPGTGPPSSRTALAVAVLVEDGHLPLFSLANFFVGQPADRPLVARLDNPSSQQPIGFVQRGHNWSSDRTSERGPANLTDQVKRLLERADQVALLDARAARDIGQVLSLRPSERQPVEVRRQRPRDLQAAPVLLPQHPTVKMVDRVPQAMEPAC